MAYKNIIILGSAKEASHYKGAMSIARNFCITSDCFLIATKRESPIEGTLKLLQGKIGYGTTIHVLARGMQCQNNKHCLQLSEDKIYRTNDVLNSIPYDQKQPVYVIVYSCYTGLVLQDVYADTVMLPKGSVLITHGAADKGIVNDIISAALRASLYHQSASPYHHFISHMAIFAATSATLTTLGIDGSKVFNAKVDRNIALTNPESSIRKKQQSFQIYYNKLQSASSQNMSPYLQHGDISLSLDESQGVINFLTLQFLQAASNQDNNDVIFLHQFAEQMPDLFSHILKGDETTSGYLTYYPPLHTAAAYGRQSIVEFLVKHHADVNVISSDCFTPLLSATLEKHLSVITYLVRAGANLNYITHIKNQDGSFGASTLPLKSAILLMQDTKVIGHLVEMGADINLIDHEGASPLFYALSANNATVLAFILHLGANPTLRYQGLTASELAILIGCSQKIQTIISEAVAAYEALTSTFINVTPTTEYLALTYHSKHSETTYISYICNTSDKALYSFLDADYEAQLVCQYHSYDN